MGYTKGIGKGHIFVGMTDTGKSYHIKNNILPKIPNKNSLFIFDINNEYKDFFPYDFIEFEDFAHATTLLKNSVILYEEATVFLDGRMKTDKDVKRVLSLKSHRNNYVILVFHSFREIPRYVYQLCNYITVFKTNEVPKTAISEIRDERLIPIIQRVHDNKSMHYNETFKIL